MCSHHQHQASAFLESPNWISLHRTETIHKVCKCHFFDLWRGWTFHKHSKNRLPGNSEILLKSCEQIRVGPPAVYKLKKEPVFEYHKVAAFWIDTGSPGFGTDSLHKVLMIVGATGCGKSTIINALANYTLGVSFTDDYRYQLISPHEEGGQSQAFSQTSRVTAYTFPRRLGSPVPYTLTIVDTPGYGDTGGID